MVRIEDHPRSIPGVVGGIVGVIAVGLVIRFLVTPLIGDTYNTITTLGLIGGGLGAIAMLVAMDWLVEDTRLPTAQFWTRAIARNREEGPEEFRRQGTWLHVTYGAIMGALFPKLFWGIFGSNVWIADYPLAPVGGVLFGFVMFLLAMFISITGLIDRDFEPVSVARFLGLHLLYGLIVGLVCGLYFPVVVSILDITNNVGVL